MSSDNFAHSSHVGHVVPLKMLIGVLMALLFLTFVTVAVTWVEMDRQVGLIVAIAVATLKASLVLLFFMHLRWDRPFNAIVIIFSIVLVGLFIIFSLFDSAAYQPTVIPGYAPELEQ